MATLHRYNLPGVIVSGGGVNCIKFSGLLYLFGSKTGFFFPL